MIHVRCALPVLALAVLLLMAEASAAAGEFGFSVAAGDIDRDGVDDIVVGDRSASPGDLKSAGQVRVFSGKSGKAILEVNGSTELDYSGWSVAVLTDVNGDGQPDLIVGAPQAAGQKGRVRVVSGKDGSAIWSKEGSKDQGLGWSVAALGDMNEDGIPDVLVGAPGADIGTKSWGRVFVLSGKDGAEIRKLKGLGRGDRFGITVANAGDVNGDGVPDFIVGAPYAGRNGQGAAKVYSGKNCAVLRTVRGKNAGENLGDAVAAAGDHDGDGKSDLLIGASGSGTDDTDLFGRVLVLSGRSGKVLLEIPGGRGMRAFGFSVACLGDANGDGRQDYFIGAPFWGGMLTWHGHIGAFSGESGARLWKRPGSGEQRLGWAAGTVADMDSDGVRDVVVGAPANPSKPSEKPQVLILSGKTGRELRKLDSDSR